MYMFMFGVFCGVMLRWCGKKVRQWIHRWRFRRAHRQISQALKRLHETALVRLQRPGD